MWLITPIGFFSVVQKPGDKRAGTLTVRSRVRSDLAALKEHDLPGLGAITESTDTDYRFRATAPRNEVSAAMARMIDRLDYSNFKSEVERRQGQARAKLYHEVWSVLYSLQTDPAFDGFVQGDGSSTLGGFHWKTVAPKSPDESVCIVRLGGEGGEIRLLGIPTGASWKFRVEVEQTALFDLIDDGDPLSVVERPWVSTWRSALKQLDTYPWVQLQPLEVHENFVSKVHQALQTRRKKGLSIPWDEWLGVLQPFHSDREHFSRQVDEPPSERDDRLGSGFASQVSAVAGKPILASLNVTTDLLRKFSSDALGRRGDFMAGKIDGPTAQARDIEQARALADLFIGRGPMASDYFVQPWNSAEQLGQWLVDTYKMQSTPDESVFVHLVMLINGIFREMDFITDNDLDMDDQIWRLDGLIEIYAHAFTGIPYPPTE